MAIIFITATSNGASTRTTPYVCGIAFGWKNGYKIKLTFAPKRLPYKVPSRRICVCHTSLAKCSGIRDTSTSLSCVKKSRSSDSRWPTCNVKAVPPARYHEDWRNHSARDKKSSARFVSAGRASVCHSFVTSSELPTILWIADEDSAIFLQHH